MTTNEDLETLKQLALRGAYDRRAEIAEEINTLGGELQRIDTIISNLKASVAPVVTDSEEDRPSASRTLTASQRKAISIRMKNYWEKRRRDAKRAAKATKR